jgi:NAD(P)-dependent dehydrogenase (short-subunit alcohol dehydrogenase family)
MNQLDGKVALVTGATGGIGEATVRRFLENGARVMAVGRSAEKLEALAGRVDGGEALKTCIADATDEAATRASIEATVSAFGGLDVLFANAGTEGHAKPLEALTVEEFREPLETNIIGVWLDIKHAAPVMRESGGGSIVVTASIASVIGAPGIAHYAASKHGVLGLVRTAALELGESGIRVNAIAPGPVDNRMWHSIRDQLASDDPGAMDEMFKAKIALGRFATNEEVASMALFLASDQSSYSSGAVFTLDGAYTAA